MFPLAIHIAVPLLSGPAVFVTWHRKGPRSAPRAGYIFYLPFHSKFQPPPLEIPGLPNKHFGGAFSSWPQKSKEDINSLELGRPEYRHCPWLQEGGITDVFTFFQPPNQKDREKKMAFQEIAPHYIHIYFTSSGKNFKYPQKFLRYLCI